MAETIINTGYRKSSIAKVIAKPGTGKILINGKDYKEYFPSFYSLANKIVNNILHFKQNNVQFDDICIISRNTLQLKKMEEVIEQHNKTNTTTKIQYISLIDNDNTETKPKIKPNILTLTTIHKSKGLEWGVVFLIGCNDDQFPNKKDHLSMEEERRLFYVAVTRAKKHLYFYLNKNTKFNNALTYVTRFIQEIPNNTYKYITGDESIFGLSTFDKKFYEKNIFKIIKSFREEDFEHLRNINFLDNLDYNVKIVHEPNVINQRIYDELLQGDFSDFISKFCNRYVQKSHSQIFDKCGFYVTRPCILNNFEYMIYTKSINFFEMIFKQFTKKIITKNNKKTVKNNKAINNNKDTKKNKNITSILNPVHMDEVIKQYHEYSSNKNSIINDDKNDSCLNNKQTIKEEEISAVKNIMNKTIAIGINFNIKLKYIYFCNESVLPKEFRKKMKHSYKNYGNNDEDNDNVLEDIYNISLCQNIYANRKRLLYRDDLFTLFIENNDNLLGNIKTTLNHLCQNEIKTNKLIKNKKYELEADVDFIDGNSIVLVRMSSSDNFNLLWLMQVIGIISVIEYNKKTLSHIQNNKYNAYNIQEACIYNPLRGIIFVVNLNHWILHFEKSKYFIEYLDFVRERQNNNSLTIPAKLELHKNNVEKCMDNNITSKNLINKNFDIDKGHIDLINDIISERIDLMQSYLDEIISKEPCEIIAFNYKLNIINYYYDKYYKIGNTILLNNITKTFTYKYLVLDTETNGIPIRLNYNNYHSYKHTNKYNCSRIVQMSWIIYDNNEKLLEEHDYIIKPNNFSIENSNIHGITNDIAKIKGRNLRDIMDIFIKSLKEVTFVVCHNINFDINVIKSELYRLGRQDLINLIDKKILICTLETANNCMKKLGLIKSTKLEELYNHFTQEIMEGAHNSRCDVIATNVVFCNLVNGGYLLLPKLE